MVVGVLLFFVYMYYYMDHLHFHVLNAYANVGVSHAQHHVAHKYLNGEKPFGLCLQHVLKPKTMK